MKKIAIVVGTRPEAIKLIPLYLALKKNENYNVILISTGQHQKMLNQIFDFFETTPNYDLGVMVHNQTLTSLTAKLLLKLGSLFEDIKPDAVIVQGDTTTCLTGALAAYYQQIRVVHIEAGLRTGNKFAPFPEEVNRKLVADIADMHFPPTHRALHALKQENINESVYVVGNTVVDSLLIAKEKIYKQENKYKILFKYALCTYERLILITCHRRESFGTGLNSICQAIKSLAILFPNFSFFFPVHLNPNIQRIVNEILCEIDNVFLSSPLPYDQMVYLMNEAYLIMTDSGGIQEEAPSLKKPVMIMRETTERPEGVEAGCSVLVGTNKSVIEKAFLRILNDPDVYDNMSKGNNPYGDGKASLHIVKYIDQLW
ncbi:UDP-N-acetylglucosamine 2-epimerase (non-hydrolyzing) [Catalinimonas alkaloidigena]|uniref:non-hydrolyzing UDP-N-acetylglucosamine 2-epimerase n=1 Tax=Catalinimonas alkaloidigena TaxID=1075417 RepID=UPI0024061504|nr:UDP-N-acetylglucosamine 2-epimerase (non-hydrolyzing) [Catalinimonas alkaloidigena]MDF9795220.1 UDP-N-acetylglucosamine 2-epimerase (non-hydrolyzing) [Catalinimonas alkaloidigena]